MNFKETLSRPALNVDEISMQTSNFYIYEKRESVRYFESTNAKRHDWLNEEKTLFIYIEELLSSDISGQ